MEVINHTITNLIIFVLAIYVGYHVVWTVTPALHTPLMAVTNALSAVVVVGAMLAAALTVTPLAKFMGVAAVALAAVIPGTQVGVGLLLVAMLIDWVKRPDARGTWQESHYSWRIRSVLIAGVLYVVTAPLLLVVVGLLLWFVISLWLLYRIVRGMVCMADNRAVSS